MFNLEIAGEQLLSTIKHASWFPYANGKLRDEATSGYLEDEHTYTIKFDSSVAPYIDALEYGSKEHDIPFAFVGKGHWVWWTPFDDGIPFLFGMGGRFNGKFHPGSTKHKGFISDKSVNAVINYFKKNYNGEVK